MTRQGNALAVLIIGSVLIFALAMPSILTAGSDLVQGLKDWVKEGFGDWGQLSGSNSRTGLLVHYDDGTENLFEPSIPSISIYDPDATKIVVWVKAQAYVTITKSGTVSSWSCSGKLKTTLKDAETHSLVFTWADTEWSRSGSSWANIGQSELMAERTITAEELDNILSGAGGFETNDQFQLRCYAEVNEFSMTFQDGHSETWTRADISAYTITWTFMWLISEIQSISVSISLEKG